MVLDRTGIFSIEILWIYSPSTNSFVKLIEVRDKPSYHYLVNLGVNPSKIEITRDLVWDLDLPTKYNSTSSLAVVLRAWEGAP